MRPVPLLALLGACTVVDAPDTLEELAVFGFSNFRGEEAVLQATFDELVPLVDLQREEMSEGYRVDSLTAEHLEMAGVSNPTLDGIIGAMGTADYRHDLAQVLIATTWPDKAEIFDNYVAYDVVDDDLDCFLAGECDTWDATITQTTKVPVVGEATYTLQQTYRWMRPEVGEPWVASVVLAPDPIDFKVKLLAVKQQYQFIVLQPLAEGTRRIETFWVEAEVIGLDVPEASAVDKAAREISQQVERIDAFLDTLEE